MSKDRTERGLHNSGRLLVVLALIGVLLGATATVLRVPILRGLGQWLVVDDAPLQPADALFVLNGGVETRPFHAAALYHKALAPTVLIVRVEDSPPAELGLIPNETDINVSVMESQDVPRANITILPYGDGAASTYDEAVALRRYVERQPLDRVLIVTSAFHTRRARWIMNQVLQDVPTQIEVNAAPHWDFDATNWWTTERGLIYFFQEIVKLAYYWLTYP